MTMVFMVSDNFIDPGEMDRKDAKQKLDTILHMNIIQDISHTFGNENLQLYSNRIYDDVVFVERFLSVLGYNQDLNGQLATERVSDVYYSKILKSIEGMYELENMQEVRWSTIDLKSNEKFRALLTDYININRNDIVSVLDERERLLLSDYYSRFKTYKEKKYSPETLGLHMLYYMRAKNLESFITNIPEIEKHRSLWCVYYKQQIWKSMQS